MFREQSTVIESVGIGELINENIEYNHQKIIFFKSPLPNNGMVYRMKLIRKWTGLSKLYPKYYLMDELNQNMLLNAKKMAGNKSSNYHISIEKDVFEK